MRDADISADVVPAALRLTDRLLVDADGVAELKSVSAATVHRWRAADKLPRPLVFSSGCVRWSVESLRRWVRECEAAGRVLTGAEFAALTDTTDPR